MTLDVNELWMQVQQRLRTFIARRVPNEVEVDDILQDVFLRMHRRLDSLKDPRRGGVMGVSNYAECHC